MKVTWDVGTKFVVRNPGECPDVTAGRQYMVAGRVSPGGLYFYDDVGDQNFAMADTEDSYLFDYPDQIEILK